MDIIQKIRQHAAEKQKTIVLPEYGDKRVVEASRIIEQERVAKVILLTKDKIDPGKKEKYIQQYYQLRQAKGITVDEVRNLFDTDTLYYAAMMTRFGEVDGFVAGAAHTSADVARSAIHCLGIDRRITIACSCFIMSVPNCQYGEDGNFIFADCGVIPEPNSRQLAYIALAASDLAKKVLSFVPKVALLSYSTKGSAEGKSIDKVEEALKIIKSVDPDLIADGELQVDAAIVPEVAKIKYPDSRVAGKANVLIFPSLEAGNIGYKLTQRLAGARAIGPILMGLNKPCSDLSRGCSVDDVVDCVAVTAIRAQ